MISSPSQSLRLALVAPLLLAAVPIAAADTAAAERALAAFQDRHGTAWRLETDGASGRPRRLTGGAIPWTDRGDPAGPPSERRLRERAEAFAREHAGLLGLEAGSLRVAPDGIVAADAGRFQVVALEVARDGVPVAGSRVTFVVSAGNLIHVHAVDTEPVTALATPRVEAAAAEATALAAAAFERGRLAREPATRLVFRREGQGQHRLVWEVELVEVDAGRRLAQVDAATAALVALSDETVYCLPAAAPTARRVVGGVRPESADDAERVEILGLGTIAGRIPVGPDGLFAPPGEPYTAALAGAGPAIVCVGCTNPAVPQAPGLVHADVDFGTGGQDGTGNGRSTPADRAAWHHAIEAGRFTRRWLPGLPFLLAPLPLRTNFPSSCNAYFDGNALTFFRSSLRCGNTGEIRDVIQHEWGHALDAFDGLPPPPLAVDAATGEAVADLVALLRSRDACVGESFHRDPARFPSTGCSGVRDLDELAPGLVRGTLTTGNVTSKCPPSGFYRGPLGREGHCEGEILGQAVWHLVQDLRTGISYGSGAPLADPPLADDVAFEVVEQLFFRSRPILASYAPSNLQRIGISAYDAFLLADDEGDGIANGTPHAEAINDAFTHHGIAEPSLAPDAAPCAAPADAALALDARADDATGLPAVELTWAGTAGIAYQVLRADAPDDAFLEIEAVAAAPFRVLDRAVLPGRTYRYRLVAEDAAGCRSAGSAAATSVPLPHLQVEAVTVDDRFPGNGDGRLEVGEGADLSVTLHNAGAATAAATSARLVAASPELAIVAGGPAGYGDIAPGATAAGATPFRVRMDPGCPRYVFLLLQADTGLLCLHAETLLELVGPDLALADRLTDDGAGGDGDLRWEPGETTDLEVWLANPGTADADPVSGTLAFRGAPVAGVTLRNDTTTWGRVPAGVPRVPSVAPRLALEADAAVPPATAVPLVLTLRIGPDVFRAVDVDLLVGGFPAGEVDWLWPVASPTRPNNRGPLVLHMTDDDGDGEVTACDTPAVVFDAWDMQLSIPRLAAASGADGSTIWDLPDPCGRVAGFSAIAGGDLDGDGAADVVVPTQDRNVCAISSRGTLLWRTTRPVNTDPSGSAAPQVLDLDGDGLAEVIAGHTVLRGIDGSVLWERPEATRGRVLVADIDGDGSSEIVARGGRVFRADGTTHPVVFPTFLEHGLAANLDEDTEPELVTMGPQVTAYEANGTIKWVYSPPGPVSSPPCAGDLDGDGLAEVVVPNHGLSVVTLDDDGRELWRMPIEDGTGVSTGCAVFDFDGDGFPEVTFRDGESLWIFDGRTGRVLWRTATSSSTSHEVAVVADVDNDGHAEIVTGGYDGANGVLHAFGSRAWEPARGVWHQENYSVTEVDEVGRVVPRPRPRWLDGNDYRGQQRVRACPCALLAFRMSMPDCGQVVACFDASGADPALDLTWDFGDGSPPVEDVVAPCHAYPGPGDYRVVLRGADATGCRPVAHELVRVRERPLPDFTVTTRCDDLTSCFAASVSGGLSPFDYAWDFGDGSPAEARPDPCHDLPAPATYTVSLEVRDANGCRGQIVAPVEKPSRPLPVPSVGNTLLGTRVGGEASFVWAAVVNATSFEVERDADKRFGAAVVVARPAVPAHADVPPPADCQYYRVVGVNCKGERGP